MAVSTRQTNPENRRRFRREAKDRRQAASVWEQMEEAPRPDLPDGRALARRDRIAKWTVVAVIAVFPVQTIMLFSKLSEPAVVVEGGAGSAATVSEASEGRASAQLAVQEWVGSDPSPLPGAQVLTWNGVTPVGEHEVEDEDGSSSVDYTLEEHSFTVTVPSDGGVTMLRVAVLLGRTPSGGVSVLGTPSLSPVPSADDPTLASADPWAGVDTVDVPEAVDEAVNVWARAFTSGNAGELRIAVGDPETDRGYLPLSGVRLVSVEVGAAAAAPGSEPGEEVPAGFVPERMLVRVELQMSWDSQGRRVDGQTPTVTYDLLVDSAGSGTPKVVAWGGPGTGPSLERYGNAVAISDAVRKQMEEAEAGSPTETERSVQPPRDAEKKSSNKKSNRKKTPNRKKATKRGGRR